MPPSAGSGPHSSDRTVAKAALRRRLLEARASLVRAAAPAAAAPVADEGAALRDRVLDLPELSSPGTVAAYASMGHEPPTGPLLDALHLRPVRLLLPVLLPDLDLDWARYDGTAALRRARRGLREPATDRLGPAAVASADVVVVPGLAAAADGTRLGRGGGSYDRALARVRVDALVVLLLWEGEDGLDVPREPHDRPVDVVVTPRRTRRI